MLKWCLKRKCPSRQLQNYLAKDIKRDRHIRLYLQDITSIEIPYLSHSPGSMAFGIPYTAFVLDHLFDSDGPQGCRAACAPR